MRSIGHFDIGKHDIGSFLLKASRGKAVKSPIVIPSPIAKYEAYNYTNESDGREILTDLTGNGHDIRLYNFAFAENSGFGLYATDFSNWTDNVNRGDLSISKNSIIIKSFKISKFPVIYKAFPLGYSLHLKIQISGITDSMVIEMGNGDIGYKLLKNGLNEISGVITDEINQIGIRSNSILESCDITIEQIPDYKGALVSDGIDDYGLCENFPILTKENGYTVCAIRKLLNGSKISCFISKRKNGSAHDGAFEIERIMQNGSGILSNITYSFGQGTYFKSNNDIFTFQKSNLYNSTTIEVGNQEDTDKLCLFISLYNIFIDNGSFALYALEIYDRDLTDSEINAVKTRMLKKYNNQEDTTSDWYGIEWYTNQSSSAVTRIGNVNLHKSLPIQSGMYRCVLNDNGEEVYKLNPNDSTKKEDGTPAVLDGTDGMVMVWIPVFYAKFETKGYRRRVLLSDHYKKGFKKMGGCYVSAYEATIDRTITGLIKLASVVNTTENFRGGNNNAEWDGTYRSLLGMPSTSTSLTNFRTYARNRKADSTEWNCMEYEAYKAIYWLYVVEYANLNCQLDFNDELTAEGYRQGGLGAGVTNLNGEKWNTFNGYYPFITCGYTNSLGNKTGVVAFTMPDEYDAETPLTTYVQSYRGIENPFGHIWKWTDGIHVKVQSEEAGGKSILYTSDDPANYQDADYDGYEEKGEIARANGYVKEILFGDDGDIIVSKDGNTGGSATTYFCDYFYTNIPSSGEVLRGVLFGGTASSGTSAGFTCAYTTSAPSNPTAYFGSRLCFIPNNNN